MSLPAFDHLDRIKHDLQHHDTWHFLLDFDGTLAPIVSQPEDAKLDPEAQRLLGTLMSVPGVRLTILSGRSLADLRKRVPPDLNYAGNHGLEIEGPGFQFREPSVPGEALRALLNALHASLDEMPGVKIEDKELTASVHFRNADPANEAAIQDIVMQHTQATPFHLRKGKKVIEIRPNFGWNKGRAARYLVDQNPRAYPIAIGDDETDEDMFRALPEALTVRVGDRSGTAARYYVEDQIAALSLLEKISLCLEAAGRDRKPR